MLSTLFTGRNLLKLQETDSTNSYLQRLLVATDLPEGTAVMAQAQTAGRGQAGAVWSSEPGMNLLASFLFKPHFLAAGRAFLLSKATALAVKDMLEEAGIEALIKWPNDIYVNEQKICGMLTENAMRGERWQHAVVGIGLNVNQTSFPPQAPGAVSMKSITGRHYDVDDVLAALCNMLEKRYLQLSAGRQETINKDYHASLYRLNGMFPYEAAGRRFNARIERVQDDGYIVLQKEDGNSQSFAFKELIYMS